MFQSNVALPKDTIRPPSQILVNVGFEEVKVAVLENEQLSEIHIERIAGPSLVGNIYLGKVIRVLPGMQSAFIDIGFEKAGFLHILDMIDQDSLLEKKIRIEEVVFEGQRLIVQVIKDAVSTKGAKLSTLVSFVGRYLVFLPHINIIRISQRIENEFERVEIQNRLEQILPDKHLGYIVRTNALDATSEELILDIKYMKKSWEDVIALSKKVPSGTLLKKEIPIYMRILRDIIDNSTQNIMVNSQSCFDEMIDFSKLYMPNLISKINYIENLDNFFDIYKIEEEIDKALQPRVELGLGSYLIIETTEAMTTIDVNTGGFVGTRNFQETILKTNINACYSIARQLRLRNIVGMIIIDFIDLEDKKDKETVLKELAFALSLDRTKVTLNGFTSLGLVELTRKRARESLKELLTEKCSYCKGKGYVKTKQTVCLEILKNILDSIKKHSKCQGLKILASPSVIDMLLTKESDVITSLSNLVNKPIYLVEDSRYDQEKFDILII